MYGILYCPPFPASTGALGTDPLQTRGATVRDSSSASANGLPQRYSAGSAERPGVALAPSETCSWVLSSVCGPLTVSPTNSLVSCSARAGFCYLSPSTFRNKKAPEPLSSRPGSARQVPSPTSQVPSQPQGSPTTAPHPAPPALPSWMPSQDEAHPSEGTQSRSPFLWEIFPRPLISSFSLQTAFA